MEARLIEILYATFPQRVNGYTIQANSRLVDDLALDSMEMLELLVALEDAFMVRFDAEDPDFPDALSTVSSVARHISALRGRVSP